MNDPSVQDVVISMWTGVPDRIRAGREIDAVFFEASGTKSFASEAERAAFRERWLGRYLECDPDLARVALDRQLAIVGYVVGSVDDPAEAERFADVGFFPSLAHLTRDYPAQLHVNLAPAWRGHGIGESLVEAFATAAQARGAPGVHVVTGEGMRNVGFYRRIGFEPIEAFTFRDRRLLFLGRKLTPPDGGRPNES